MSRKRSERIAALAAYAPGQACGIFKIQRQEFENGIAGARRRASFRRQTGLILRGTRGRGATVKSWPGSPEKATSSKPAL